MSVASPRSTNTAGESRHDYLVDPRIHIETPENVLLAHQLAGPMFRVGAYLVDFMLRAGIFAMIAIVLLCSSVVPESSATGVLLLLSFMLSWFYYTLFETFWNGRTPGKSVMGLRVIKEKGYPITFLAAFGRNLLRTVDALGLYLVGFVALLLSPRFQRLGDYLAGTIVVHERVSPMPREPVILEKIEPLPREDIRGQPPTPRTLALIDEFFGRRHTLSIAHGHRLAKGLAVALSDQLRYAGDQNAVRAYPMAFLARVHVTFHGRQQDALTATTMAAGTTGQARERSRRP